MRARQFTGSLGGRQADLIRVAKVCRQARRPHLSRPVAALDLHVKLHWIFT
jgi:hypothetical protein